MEHLQQEKLLEYLAAFVANQMLNSSASDIFERFLARERLGSTGIGEGIAIPHCRLSQCQKPLGVLLKLDEAIDYDAIDHRPRLSVCLVCARASGQPTSASARNAGAQLHRSRIS